MWFRRAADFPAAKSEATYIVDSRQEAPDGPRKLLGEVKIEDGRFTLTTNSRERFDAARASLERVDRVKLISVKARPTPVRTRETAPASVISDEPPTDPQHGPDVVDERLLESARMFLTNHYRQWVDQPNPALRGRTPRQAAKDPRLRAQLAAMVRTMPDPVNLGDDGIRLNAPRRMLLTELGLD